VAGGPGARRSIEDGPILDWIARASARARRTTSVCTGSYLLAAAGLLDGRRATTHWLYADELQRHLSSLMAKAPTPSDTLTSPVIQLAPPPPPAPAPVVPEPSPVALAPARGFPR